MWLIILKVFESLYCCKMFFKLLHSANRTSKGSKFKFFTNLRTFINYLLKLLLYTHEYEAFKLLGCVENGVKRDVLRIATYS